MTLADGVAPARAAPVRVTWAATCNPTCHLRFGGSPPVPSEGAGTIREVIDNLGPGATWI